MGKDQGIALKGVDVVRNGEPEAYQSSAEVELSDGTVLREICSGISQDRERPQRVQNKIRLAQNMTYWPSEYKT